ncbi:hypothetical protein K431DRAFT_326425 [Polychaeton citri CBS 116435]|uniref:RSE1/DDB1/CPSF1 first beta-propeller domain-containing protein n=1 Tax=Polychaeton citri CBS 116435 TaxID=1314669 RepID=A0A9P4USA6_9PEZI|nr:hypothetical protein K431DRAFT_326425 [Polychaeton citri CBS 116435]
MSQATRTRPQIGVLTRTVIRSPVVKHVLHARIRNRQTNDVAFVGEHFVDIKQVTEGGFLEHVATKHDFDSRIRAAATFTVKRESPEDRLNIKTEDGDGHGVETPPQLLLLTLESQTLLLLYLAKDESGSYSFRQQALPLETYEEVLFRPGARIAVDPLSRAVAIAANERHVVIFSAKPEGHMQEQIRRGDKDWSPVARERLVEIRGPLQHVEFLFPPNDDENHVILLLILVDGRSTRAAWVDWSVSSGLRDAEFYRGQELSSITDVPHLLIPIRNASFLLVHNERIVMWKNLLSRTASKFVVQTVEDDSEYPGSSPRKPLLVSWCRPLRNSAARFRQDDLYLLREDGAAFLCSIRDEGTMWSRAGNLECHSGTAFASLGGERDPDILAIAGEMCSGSIISIGMHAENFSRAETMRPTLIETIPNWASATDLLTSSLPHSSGRSTRTRDGLFVTSSRQPYGSIAEIRHGLQAKMVTYTDIPGLRHVNDFWLLPLEGELLLILSMPDASALLKIPSTFAPEEIEQLDEAGNFDLEHRTLTAGVLSDGQIFQITDHAVVATSKLEQNFEDTQIFTIDQGSLITAASFDPQIQTIVVAEESAESQRLRRFFRQELGDAMQSDELLLNDSQAVLCVALASTQKSYGIACTEKELLLFDTKPKGKMRILQRQPIIDLTKEPGVCSYAIILKPSDEADDMNDDLAICGLRDGRLLMVKIHLHQDETSLGDGWTVELGQSTVKLMQPLGDLGSGFATCGLDTYLLTCPPTGHQLSIQPIWLSDTARPEFSQGAISCVSQLPPADLLRYDDLADYNVMISGNELLVCSVGSHPTVVPRHVKVESTPTRLLYTKEQRLIVTAGFKTGVRTLSIAPQQGFQDETRQIWPVIEIIPAKADKPACCFEMQPGERVYALLDWTFALSREKTYFFLLVGGSYVSGKEKVQKGQVTFLQPAMKDNSMQINRRSSVKFNAPVYSLAWYDENTFVACFGMNVTLHRFLQETKEWEQICDPFTLLSPGVSVSVTGGRINIGTLRDSLVCLTLEDIAPAAPGHPSVKLKSRSVGPGVFQTLGHLVVPLTSPQQSTSSAANSKAHDLSDAHQQPVTTNNGYSHDSASILFTAHLPRSLTRLRQSNLRSAWKPIPPPCVLVHNIIGCSADGAVTGICLLDLALTRRLCWLQRLCEWSELLSPCSFSAPLYVPASDTAAEDPFRRLEMPFTMGFSAELDEHDKSGSAEVIVKTNHIGTERHLHVDADILARLFEHGGRAGAVRIAKNLVRKAATRDDRVGEWVSAHMEQELIAVDDIVQLVELLIDCWL